VAVRTSAVLVTGVLVGSLVACDASGSDDPPADPAVLVDARPASVAGTELWVQLPTGRLTVTVGEPVTTIPAGESRVQENGVAQEITASDGEAFLPIQVEEKPGAGVPGVIYQSATRDDTVEPEVSIRVGGEDYALGATEEIGSLPVYARVDRPDDSPLGVAVEYAGVTQSVDQDGARETGAAAGLYDLPDELEQRRCPGRWTTAPDAAVTVECTYVVGHYPYLAGLGWAHEQEPDGTWAFVATATSLGSADLAGGPRCDAVGLEGSGNAVLDGEPAATDLATFTTPTTADGSFVSLSQAFPVPEATTRHDLTIQRTYPCRSDGEARTLRLTTEFPIDAD
jgi:hypothetical protein